jgi:hypothetical protein
MNAKGLGNVSFGGGDIKSIVGFSSAFKTINTNLDEEDALENTVSNEQVLDTFGKRKAKVLILLAVPLRLFDFQLDRRLAFVFWYHSLAVNTRTMILTYNVLFLLLHQTPADDTIPRRGSKTAILLENGKNQKVWALIS